MRLLAALDLKVLRDAGRLRGQLAAVGLVLSAGLAVFVGMRSTMRSLESARADYYAQARFGHVFAQLVRAPEDLGRRLAELPGVQAIETRIVADVTLDVPGMLEAATGRLVSLPDQGRPRVSDLYLRSGRMPHPARTSEVLASEAFAEAHGLEAGDELGAVLEGRQQRLRIVGIALSPEFTYAVGPGQIFPDDRGFGVLWMRRDVLSPAFDMEGAFNDVSLLLAREARLAQVLRGVDRLLAPYGGQGAIGRRDQVSAFFLENELAQLATLSWILPLVFLLVAAFLLHTVLGRVVSGQREQIAVLKAFGYSDREVGAHYAKLMVLVVALASLVGIGAGTWIGSALVGLYSTFYRFPAMPYRLGGAEVVLGLGIAFGAGLLGTGGAIRATLRLPPAEAMRPPAPPRYRPLLLERLGLARLVPPPARIVLRELERAPRRALLNLAGIALATALTVLNAFSLDSVRYMLNVQYGLAQRDDVELVLAEPRSMGALGSLRSLPGVLLAEPVRNVAVRLSAGTRRRSVALTGQPADATLSVLLDEELNRVSLPREGLVLSRKLASLLGVGTGDELLVEVLEGRRPTAHARVARIVDTFVGLTAHMELTALCRLLGETPTLNGARLLVDEERLAELHAAVKATPAVAGIGERERVLRHVREMLDENIGVFVTISLAFSLIMAFGILHNAARISLAERARELASLRVLGFRRREVATVLVGELALLVAVAVPLGLVLGHLMAAGLVRSPGYDTEQFRLPLVIRPSTDALAVLAVLAAATVSAWGAWRRLDRFDIVEVLKTRD